MYEEIFLLQKKLECNQIHVVINVLFWYSVFAFLLVILAAVLIWKHFWYTPSRASVMRVRMLELTLCQSWEKSSKMEECVSYYYKFPFHHSDLLPLQHSFFFPSVTYYLSTFCSQSLKDYIAFSVVWISLLFFYLIRVIFFFFFFLLHLGKLQVFQLMTF